MSRGRRQKTGDRRQEGSWAGVFVMFDALGLVANVQPAKGGQARHGEQSSHIVPGLTRFPSSSTIRVGYSA